MIAVRLEGRLGNQLFQYAFIYATAKKLGVKFYIDQSIQPLLLDDYFEIEQPQYHFLQKHVFNIQGYKNLFTYYSKNAFYNCLKKMYRLRVLNFNNTIEPNDELRKLDNRLFYTGFFQSEQYFKKHSNEIAKLFTVKESYRQQYHDVVKQFPANKTIIVVHVRRGDYLDLNYHLPQSYYRTALDSIKNADPFYVFISDDPDYVKTEFAYLTDKYISYNPEIVDFQLLQNADVCVLSNSSFSWWAAWLNPKKNKMVYAPKYWMGFQDQKEMPTGITKNLNWVQL